MLARLKLVCCAVALCYFPLRAQSVSDWAGLNHTPALSAGIQIEVRTTGNQRSRGQFTTAEDDALVMMTPSGPQRIPRATVTRISARKPGHRLRNTLIGLGVGAAAGLAVGAEQDASCSPHCFLGNNLAKAILTPAGALVGLIVGVVIPTGGWREVYRAP
jgi:hypothetical protein